MSAVQIPVILCGACQRKFSWKPELAGKRVKCKCGEKISVPVGAGAVAAPAKAERSAVSASPARAARSAAPTRPAAPIPAVKTIHKAIPVAPPEPDGLDGLLALAEDADRAAAAMPIEVMEFAPQPVVPVPTKPTRSASSIPLAYQRGQTAQEKEKALAAAAALTDPVRDLYAPLVILVVGFGLHLGYYIVRYNLGSAAIAPIGMGVVLLTVIKAALLVGFALIAAGPLGVSFGAVWSAILKLAAIAVFTDGAIAWVDLGMARLSGGFGGGGFFGWGAVGFPVAMGLYWGLLIYLFSMDPGDSWMVVACLSIFDRIVRTVVMLLLLETILGWGGVVTPALPGSSSISPASAHASALSTEVDDLKQSDSLVEARQYIQDGHQGALMQPVTDWYAAGCPNVWFAMSGRDINGRRSATGVIVELPTDKAARAKCCDILQKYYTDNKMFSDPSQMQDTGEQYLEVGIE